MRLLCLLLSGAVLAAPSIDTLRAAQPPRFAASHTLPPLTRWGWTLPYEVRVELAERWGYALEYGGYVTDQSVKALDDPNSTESKLVALCLRDPKRYRLAVLTIHGDFGKLPDDVVCHGADGQPIGDKPVISPEAPAAYFAEAGARWAEPIARLRTQCPIAIVLNGGEYGLGVYGFAGKTWEQDPAVMRAKGEQSWLAYLSAAKARQELPISEAFRRAVPDRELYLYYTTSGNPHHDRYADWWHWGFDYEPLRPISDLANMECYYKSFNSGWTGDMDLLTLTLNSVARQHRYGDALTYNWFCAGWRQAGKQDEAVISDREHYFGYLKCCYTAGSIGGVAGYFSVPREDDPNWLWQMMALGHVQAQFSHLETFLRQGDLLPGPDHHRIAKDLPAYELPTGDRDARVLVRRLRARPEWLICAWAAGGDERDVRVSVPELGQVTLRARACGSVYRATLADGQPKLTLTDPDGLDPSRRDRSVLEAEQLAERLAFMHPPDGFAQQRGDRQRGDAVDLLVGRQRHGVGNDDLADLGPVEQLDGAAGEQRMRHRDADVGCGTGGQHGVDTVAQRLARGDNVFEDERALALEVAGDVRDLDLLLARAVLVDDRHRQFQQAGHLLGGLGATGVGRHDHAVGQVGLAQVVAEHAQRGQMIDGDVEETLDGSGVQVHGDHAVRAGHLNQVRYQARGDRLARGVLLLLASVAVVGHHRGDALGAGAFETVDGDQQLHQVVVDRRTARLKDKDVCTAHILMPLHEHFTVGELLDRAVDKRHFEVGGDGLGQRGIRTAAEQLVGLVMRHVRHLRAARWKDTAGLRSRQAARHQTVTRASRSVDTGEVRAIVLTMRCPVLAI